MTVKHKSLFQVNRITLSFFFRDHPSVLADEASPGFVSDIIIGNEAWTPEEVVEVWEDFCGSLLDINEIAESRTLIFPNPAQNVLYVSLENTRVKADVQIFDLTGRIFAELRIQENVNSIEVSFLKKGMYLIKIIHDSKIEIHKFKKE